jgi:hypothetical protein
MQVPSQQKVPEAQSGLLVQGVQGLPVEPPVPLAPPLPGLAGPTVIPCCTEELSSQPAAPAGQTVASPWDRIWVFGLADMVTSRTTLVRLSAAMPSERTTAIPL